MGRINVICLAFSRCLPPPVTYSWEDTRPIQMRRWRKGQGKTSLAGAAKRSNGGGLKFKLGILLFLFFYLTCLHLCIDMNIFFKY